MNMTERTIDVRRQDRLSAAQKIQQKLKLTDYNSGRYEEGETKDIFSKTVLVPVTITLLENDLSRRVVINSMELDRGTLAGFVSDDLIEAFVEVAAAIKGADTLLGSDHLSDKVDDILGK